MSRMIRFTKHLLLAVSSIAVATAAYPHAANALGGGVGADYTSGPGSQNTRDALGYVTAKWAATDLILVGARFDNSQVGAGTSGSIGVGVPAGTGVTLRLQGARSIGDETYRAWRVQAGPQIAVGGGRTLGLYYLHIEDNVGSFSNGVSTEVDAQLSPTVAGSLGASIAAIQEGQTGAQGSASVTWAPVHHLQLVGDMSVGKNVIGVSEIGSADHGGGPLGKLPIIGNGSSKKGGSVTQTQYGASATAAIGVRFLFP